ncbi:MAG TPA: dihydrolipoamide acetyltransferase family protein [Bacteroidales bacterium]|nr:dihydrolipoamide acetyltransferase family protein [Bacteroidales bacterium]
MPSIEIVLPSMGEGVIEATVTRWLVEEGTMVEEDQPLVEVATDKVDSEIPAPKKGILKKHLVEEEQIAKVGQPLAVFETEGEEEETADHSVQVPTAKLQTGSVEQSGKSDREAYIEEPKKTSSFTGNWQEAGERTILRNKIKYTPAGAPPDATDFIPPYIQNIAAEYGINREKLSSLNKEHPEGLTRNILQGYAKTNKAGQLPQSNIQQSSPVKKDQIYGGGEHEIVEMDRMRRLIAENTSYSKHTSAHVTSFSEADLTNLVLWREKNKDAFLRKYGEKLTFTPILIEAIALAIKEFPMINISVDNNFIIKKKEINIGMAAALPGGNLIVPVIKNADRLNLSGLAAKVNSLARRARENKLLPQEVKGGTFTLTNLGAFGNISGTPVINQPEVAILATGAIKKKPAVVSTPEGDTIGIRHIMVLSLSYDHRVVDGGPGGMFLERVAKLLENFDLNREI